MAIVTPLAFSSGALSMLSKGLNTLASPQPCFDSTFVIAAVEGANTIAYAFNGRVSQFQIDSQPGAEAKAVFTVHPRGNQYGWSNNT